MENAASVCHVYLTGNIRGNIDHHFIDNNEKIYKIKKCYIELLHK